MLQITQGLLENALPAIYHKAILEIKVYLDESFGNAIRIDYGTGHETSFIMFLYCFYKIGALKQNDKIATVCVLFNKYVHIVKTYFFSVHTFNFTLGT